MFNKKCYLEIKGDRNLGSEINKEMLIFDVKLDYVVCNVLLILALLLTQTCKGTPCTLITNLSVGSSGS